MSDYRINVRVRSKIPEEAAAVKYLQGLTCSKNDFIVDSVLAKIYDDRLLRDIRQIFREEILSIPAQSFQPVHQTVSTELTEEEKNQVSHRGRALEIMKEELKKYANTDCQ